ncbi:tail fibers protein [Salmonella phage 38]|uniref:Tail fibers protein n=1 Tax=Salmonella phage 38 TaxID=1654891 RepID=A0A0N7CCL4_9CAUD|nr:tail fibers protein [Salmonella phage 38]AKJ73660.1 tail fibers protein [Salmonella phage 38]
MLAALSWLEGVPFGKLTGRVGAKYRIQQSLVMKFDGSYTQDVTSTRYIDFTGTTIVAGASGITCLRMSHDFCHIINPVVINPDNYSDVIAYAIAPEDESQTTVRVSQQFCVMENPRARGTKIGLKFKPGPTVGGSNSGAYYHSIMNPILSVLNVVSTLNVA